MDQKTLNQFAIGLAGIGILLILVSILMANNLLPFLSNEGTWSNEDAVAYEESAMAFHNASFDKKLSEDELKETEAEYLANRERLDAVLDQGKTWPRILQVAGFVFVGLGIVAYVAAVSKQS